LPCTGAYNLCKTKGLSSHWWPTRLSSATYATRDTSSGGVLVSSYCSSYRVADPFSSLGTFSSSFIGGPVFPPIDDCHRLLLYFSGTDTWNSRRRMTNVWILPSFLDWGTNTHGRSYREKVWSWDRRKVYPETAPPRDPSRQTQTLLHMQARFCSLYQFYLLYASQPFPSCLL
jgi:hypothetical protein